MQKTRPKPKTIMGRKFDAAAYQSRSLGEIKTYEVALPSGFVFTLRRPNVQGYGGERANAVNSVAKDDGN